MLVAACVARMIPWPGWDIEKREAARWSFWPLLPAAGVLAAALAYGTYRTHEAVPGAAEEPVRVALIQGSLDTVFDITPERIEQTFTQYGQLTSQVRKAERQLDLIVWPESMFPLPELKIDEPLAPPPGVDMSTEQFRERIVEGNTQFTSALEGLAGLAKGNAPGAGETRVVIGTNTVVYGDGPMQIHNSAILADPQGGIAGRYYKMHGVMCGEYMPL
jgi:apolipoprotein N-acyltransferase